MKDVKPMTYGELKALLDAIPGAVATYVKENEATGTEWIGET